METEQPTVDRQLAFWIPNSGSQFQLHLVKLTLVPFLKNCPRAPLGPSVVLIDGIPCSGIATVRQKSDPASKEI
jgi:hypothetical protein